MRRGLFPTLLFLFFSCLSLNYLCAQTVGVVLSGGGANGLAHVGVLKALEQESIPIDYICGTSIGALVGGLYASGYSPDQIEAIITSNEFKRSAQGEVDARYVYYFRKELIHPGWISLRANPDSSFLLSFIPTSFINPAALDLELMFLFSPAGAVAQYDFDKLFVPFRCVASNIEDKQSVVFQRGNLNMAVRASMSYPLYLKPLVVDGKLLFDGGLYNNFPADIMREHFNPDVIIGSNVSGNEDPPKEDDFLSQLRNMVISQTNYELQGECCVLVEPKINYSTFDFNHLQECIDSGYIEAMRHMDQIKERVHRRVHAKVVDERRILFNSKKIPMRFSEFEYHGVNRAQGSYINLLMRRKRKKVMSAEEMSKRYFRLYESDKVDRLFPYAIAGPTDTAYKLHLDVKKQKNLTIDFGGNISSRPINTGYLGLGYANISSTGVSYYGNAYFGKLYASLLGMARIDIPARIPLYLEPVVCINRWNYYNSRATFFEDNNSLFLIQNEQYSRMAASLALSNKTKFSFGGGVVSLRDDYYQVSNFGEDDITDRTLLSGSTFFMIFDKNSLNRKQYASSGTSFLTSARFTEGMERYTPGTTSGSQFFQLRPHDWVDLRATLDTYYKGKGRVRLGLYAEGVYSTMELFTNYSATSLRSQAFQPTPESRTLFLESFRALQYAAIGQKVIVEVVKNLEFRLEGYVFQPYKFVVNELEMVDVGGGLFVEKSTPMFQSNFERRYTIATANLVYNTPFGPLSTSMNYYLNLPELRGDDINPKTPVTFLIHFGYILFNDRALR